MSAPYLVQWMGDNAHHQTGYLPTIDGRAFYRYPSLATIHQHDPRGVVDQYGIQALVIPHHQPPHAIAPVWVPVAELRRWPMRSEWEKAEPNAERRFRETIDEDDYGDGRGGY